MVVVLDNYDSFTFNLVHYLAELGCEVEVLRNDALPAAAVLAKRPSHVVVSPGPRAPDQAGISLALIGAAAAAGVPLLGVCLGHQAIGQAFGGRVVRGREPVHGKTSRIHHSETMLFREVENPMVATRYHSLVVDPDLPPALERSAAYGEIVMAVRHRELPVEGVQFHPEALLTEHGHKMLQNFIRGTQGELP